MNSEKQGEMKVAHASQEDALANGLLALAYLVNAYCNSMISPTDDEDDTLGLFEEMREAAASMLRAGTSGETRAVESQGAER